jgi:hypothetical protein
MAARTVSRQRTASARMLCPSVRDRAGMRSEDSLTAMPVLPSFRGVALSFRAKRGISCVIAGQPGMPQRQPSPRHSIRVSGGVAQPRNLSRRCRTLAGERRVQT